MTTPTGCRIAAVAGIAALVVASAAIAQEPPSRGPRSAREQVTERFTQAAPGVGEPMPDVVVYDADGNERRLRELLRERYTVLVLGCLT